MLYKGATNATATSYCSLNQLLNECKMCLQPLACLGRLHAGAMAVCMNGVCTTAMEIQHSHRGPRAARYSHLQCIFHYVHPCAYCMLWYQGSVTAHQARRELITRVCKLIGSVTNTAETNVQSLLEQCQRLAD